MDKKEMREQEILEKASKVFREKGYHNARMAQIANEAGISYGLVYHYYNNKEHLFDALLDQWWDALYLMLEKAMSKDQPIKAKLETIARFFLDNYQENPDKVHLFITEVSRSTANLTPARLDMFRKWILKVEKMIKIAQRENELRQDIKARYLSTFYLGALETMISTMVLNNQPIKGQAQKNRIINQLLALFFEGAELKSRKG